jgi:riboflavin synthase
MFTGIVEDLGTVEAIEHLPAAARLTVSGQVLGQVRPGDSVSVNGVCLTAAQVGEGRFTADVVTETMRRSTIGALRAADRVNLELAVTPATRLGGHLVQGHVDGVGTVRSRRTSDLGDEVDIELPADLAKYVVSKGSIAFDGVSLTVADIEGSRVTVSLIPETLTRTMFGSRTVGDGVNVEVDVLAKYVERLLGAGASDGLGSMRRGGR